VGGKRDYQIEFVQVHLVSRSPLSPSLSLSLSFARFKHRDCAARIFLVKSAASLRHGYVYVIRESGKSDATCNGGMPINVAIGAALGGAAIPSKTLSLSWF